jgi:hypothetical protein
MQPWITISTDQCFTVAIQAEGASDAASDRLLPLLLLLLLQVHTHGKQSGCDASGVECAADGVQQHHCSTQVLAVLPCSGQACQTCGE